MWSQRSLPQIVIPAGCGCPSAPWQGWSPKCPPKCNSSRSCLYPKGSTWWGTSSAQQDNQGRGAGAPWALGVPSSPGYSTILQYPKGKWQEKPSHPCSRIWTLQLLPKHILFYFISWLTCSNCNGFQLHPKILFLTQKHCHPKLPDFGAFYYIFSYLF